MVEDLWCTTKYTCNELIQLISEYMTHNHLFMTKKLVITGTDLVTVEINPDSAITYRQDIQIIEQKAQVFVAVHEFISSTDRL